MFSGRQRLKSLLSLLRSSFSFLEITVLNFSLKEVAVLPACLRAPLIEAMRPGLYCVELGMASWCLSSGEGLPTLLVRQHFCPWPRLGWFLWKCRSSSWEMTRLANMILGLSLQISLLLSQSYRQPQEWSWVGMEGNRCGATSFSLSHSLRCWMLITCPVTSLLLWECRISELSSQENQLAGLRSTSRFSLNLSIVDMKTGLWEGRSADSEEGQQLPGPTLRLGSDCSGCFATLERKEGEGREGEGGGRREQAVGAGEQSLIFYVSLGARQTRVIFSSDGTMVQIGIILLMRGWSHTPIRTVNLNSDVFHDALPEPKEKLPLAMLRRMVERKKSYPSTRKITLERYNNRERLQQLNEEEWEGEGVEEPRGKTLHNMASFQIRRQGKTNTEIKQRSKYMSIECKGRSRSKAVDVFNSEREAFCKSRERRRESVRQRGNETEVVFNREEQRQYQTVYREEGGRLNPYTRQQYTYLANRKKDQVSEIRKQSRNKQYSTITNSYRIAHMELSPQKHHHKPNAVKLSPHKAKTAANPDPCTPLPVAVALQPDAPSPSPWEWGQQSYSMNKDFID